MRGTSRLLTFLLLLSLAACKFPADPEGTSDEVRGAVLKVGALTQLQDADKRAIDQIARAFHAELQVVQDDPHRLFALLEQGRLHIVAGQIPEDTPFRHSVALSDPVGTLTLNGKTKQQVLALRRGENAFLVTVNRALQEVAP